MSGETDGKAPVAGILGGLGVAALAVVRVCSHEVSLVDDVARLASKGAEVGAEVGAGVVTAGRAAGEAAAGAHAADAAGDAARLVAAGEEGADAASTGERVADAVVDHGLDVVDVGMNFADLTAGDEGVRSAWLGAPANLAALSGALGERHDAVVGFVVSLMGQGLAFREQWVKLEELDAACRATENTCWVFVQSGPTASLQAAADTFSSTSGDVPVAPPGYFVRVLNP